ncbi:septation protein SepH [Schumannella luteola]|uniref:DUF3071 domain-containing protein n=1 Tax=Schumannella luteola TaxID=472059 RepID=A0A852YIX0_9MICO|nr:septation protein SepH [Schumannella luteola]NYG99877.1 hypothetical protein [Schumannella luteola]TPX02192.1 DUF3071 domain-containing protein [Schumannella luteola]
MQELKVTGVEDGALVVVDIHGTEYRVAVDDATAARLRRPRAVARGERKVAPREIQAHIRAGLSADDVAAITGADVDDVKRYEGPVLAEREYIVESALSVAVHTPQDADDERPSFGSVIRTRLADAEAVDERWSSWKDPEQGWVVKVTFTANTVEHDARWGFDPRKRSLSPLNADAITLSQQQVETPAPLIPRLRAVPSDGAGESARFDSNAFRVEPGSAGPEVQQVGFGRDADLNQTADLLEALRRRRGEREPLPMDEPEPEIDHPSLSTPPSIRLVEVPLEGLEGSTPATPVADDEHPDWDAQADAAAETEPAPAPAPQRVAETTNAARAPRRSRAAMPSWDEIVFGARTDDD